MWKAVALWILQHRRALLAAIAVLALAMGYVGFTRVEVTNEFLQIVPADDPDLQQYQRFQELFGEDGSMVLAALRCPDGCFTAARIRGLDSLTRIIENKPGVLRVINLTRAFGLQADDSLGRFTSFPLMEGLPQTDAQARELRRRIDEQPFYASLLTADSGRIVLTAYSMTKEAMGTRRKNAINLEVAAALEAFAQAQGLELHRAGLPLLRTFMATQLPKEIALFTFLSLLLTALALYYFYRSFYAVVFPLILLIVSSLCTLGIVGLLDYKLTALTGLLPPIIIILGIPPSVYMLSEYHHDYRHSGEKLLALQRTVERLGLVTFMINANTAFGFLTLYLTEVRTLQEFGLVAFLGTMLAYVLTIVLIPGVFSLLPPPTDKNLRHLESAWLRRSVQALQAGVRHHRRSIYVVTGLLVALSLVGIARLEFVSYMVDDIPKGASIHTDLRFMEERFGGVMPFEIVIDGREAGAIRRPATLRRIEALQARLATYPELSRTLSVVDVLKWSRQALYGNLPEAYALPAREELDFIARYSRKASGLSGTEGAAEVRGRSPVANVVDSTWRYARITGYVRDLGSREMPRLLERVGAEVDSAFGQGERRPEVYVTGATRIFLKANDYLVDNLAWSLVATFLLIGLQMLLLFGSWRMMLISMVPNVVPLVVVAGLMGFLGMYVKPSTALIYELAFGIAIDNSIHYLTAYRRSRRAGHSLPEGVDDAMRITGMGILYTSVVLLVGFGIFTLSSFGSTQALGILTSITLFIALFANLLYLPALLHAYDRKVYLKGERALIDEDEDEDLPQGAG